MAKFELITVRKGEIKTIDAFINNFNAMGANMKALAVSAYSFLTHEDKEVRKEFSARCLDELGLSNPTQSQLKWTGYLYTLNDWFSGFAYTNVYYFKKLVDRLETVDDAHIEAMFKKLANFCNSNLSEDIELCVTFLTEMSQKELRNAIAKYIDWLDKGTEEETEEATEEETEEASEEETEEASEEELEYDDPRVSMYGDDIENTLKILSDINGDMKKDDMLTEIMKAIELLGNAYDKARIERP